jgi:hypothetical protein
MRSATLRGLAIHTADEAGGSTGPDYRFGWGLLNAERAAVHITNDGVDTMIKENTLNQGNSYTFNFEPNDDTKAIIGTVCWTDPTGTIVNNSITDFFAPALVNDLDFRISKGNTVNFPWRLNPATVTAAATKADNFVDNVENRCCSRGWYLYCDAKSQRQSNECLAKIFITTQQYQRQIYFTVIKRKDDQPSLSRNCFYFISISIGSHTNI